MKLITIKSANETAISGYTDCVLTVTTADDGTGTQFDIPFTYSNTETTGMASQVSDWIVANSSFTIGTYTAPAPTANDVWNEKDRRWALGFDYNFNDSRGIQHIDTTPKDLQGWNLVTTAAQIALNAGAANTALTIYPNTAPVTVTAAEWQQVLLAASEFFQPIMASAATLVATNPIPTDYANDSHWATS